ncbi:hypothetical protein [Rudaeicoccus suwonensis]|uniref:hypothetical protein n=1 Tax=Rudaeicoccus suwonensis TaxID=657409 RepID=UPI001476D9D2|nr:hypothetical protein [Rudaeicoccus suwonensis]
MDVIPVLHMAVTIVQVVDVITMFDRLAAVALGVCALVVGVDRNLDMALVAVDVVHVVFVLHGLATVTNVVLVVGGFQMGHGISNSSRLAVLTQHRIGRKADRQRAGNALKPVGNELFPCCPTDLHDAGRGIQHARARERACGIPTAVCDRRRMAVPLSCR